LLEFSESPSLQAASQAALQATAAPAAPAAPPTLLTDSVAPQAEEWQPVAALRSAPQEAFASTFVGVVRNWVGTVNPAQRRGLH